MRLSVTAMSTFIGSQSLWKHGSSPFLANVSLESIHSGSRSVSLVIASPVIRATTGNVPKGEMGLRGLIKLTSLWAGGQNKRLFPEV